MKRIAMFFKPPLRCKWNPNTHRRKEIKVRLRTWSREPDEIIEDRWATWFVCKDCGNDGGYIIHDRIEGYNVCEMPNSMWDELRKNGHVIL